MRILVLVFLIGTYTACSGDDSVGDAGTDDASAGDTDLAGADLTGVDLAGTDGATFKTCAPNTVEACTCTGGAAGTARCYADGYAWGACSCTTYGMELAISPTGDDTAAGTVAAPWKTLERAQTAVRALVMSGLPAGGVVVWVRGGVYPRTASFALTNKDSGTAAAPVVYRGYPGETARFIGGKQIPAASFSTVASSSPVWSRLDTTAQGKVMSVALPSQGVTDYGALKDPGGDSSNDDSGLELFIDGARQHLGRWPDADRNDPDPASDPNAAMITLYSHGASPDVSGVYLKDSVQDGVSSFTRQGLVGGKQYHFYRVRSSTYVAWFVTTNASGYPSATDPFFYTYTTSIGTMTGAQGATGTLGVEPPAIVNSGFSHIATKISDSVFTLIDNHSTRWTQAPDVWFHGFFRYGWYDDHAAVASIDSTTGTVTLKTALPPYGIDPNEVGSPIYAYNLLEEITEPGEWYLDRTNGTLYVWPTAGFATSDIIVSTLAKPIVTMNGASYVTLQELTFEASRSRLVDIEGGTNDSVIGCTLRDAGDVAAYVTGSQHVVDGALIHDVGKAGVVISGGDRPSLTKAGIIVERSAIHDFSQWRWTYTPGVDVYGNGNSVSHNLIYSAPHTAVLYTGSQHTIEYNEIHSVCSFSSDAGAIYAGRDWGARGNVVQDNFIHDVQTGLGAGFGVHGIYLDDCLSGITVQSNILYKVEGNGIEHGGGRDDLMTNNLFVQCGTAIAADARGVTSISQTPGDSGNLLEKLEALKYQMEPWASTYPACAAIPDDQAVIHAVGSHWLYPEGSTFTRNLGYKNQTWMSEQGGAYSHYAENDNNVQDADPMFVDEAHLDLTLAPGSPALAIPGFVAIPFSSIGIRP